MPTIYRYKGFRFHFFSNEGHEPPHVHIRRGDDSCKFWLQPVNLGYDEGMNDYENGEVAQFVLGNDDRKGAVCHECGMSRDGCPSVQRSGQERAG